MNKPIWFEFVETEVFTKRIRELATPETLVALQADLIEDPERWPVISGTAGARKGRVSDPAVQQGKSGSLRYLYLYLSHVPRVYLLFVFAKHEQDNLSPNQKKLIANWCGQIREGILNERKDKEERVRKR